MKKTSTEKKNVKKSFCPHSGKCGGCQLTNMTYEQQLHFKMSKVISLMGKMHRVDEIIGMDNPYYYRNKVQSAFTLTRSGKIVSGVYQSGSHRVVATDDCKTEDKKAKEIIRTIRLMLPSFKLTAYNEDTHRGFLRHVLVKRGFESGQIMVVLVSGTNIFPRKNDFVKELLRRHPDITTVVWNINSANTSLVLGKTSFTLYGKGVIEERLMGKVFEISPEAFYQINPVQTVKLYTVALDMLNLKKSDTVIDAYCGTGTIGILASDRAGSVIGAELNPHAVKNAVKNAKINSVKNIRFVCADAGEFMSELAYEKEKVDAVIMDPPRSGSTLKFLKSLVKLSPEKVLYISCNPETQARDLLYLIKAGYKVKRIQPVDMFPHTAHVENIALVSKVK